MHGPMTSRGTKAGEIRSALKAALGRGDLELASAYAKELGTVELDDAARLLSLMARNHSPAYNRAAARWMRRYVDEIRNITPDQIAEVADALAEMPTDPSSAELLLNSLRVGTSQH